MVLSIAVIELDQLAAYVKLFGVIFWG